MKPLCIVSCPIDTFSGYGARSRDFVKGLIQLKGEEWDIKILPQRWGDCPWNYLADNDPLRQLFINNTIPKQPEIWIQITVPNEFQPMGKFNIGVTAGIETTVFPAEFLDGMNRMNLNLVSSNHSKQVALSSQFEKRDKNTKNVVGVVKLEKPIEVLFEGLDLDKYYKKPAKSPILKDIKEDFCFLYTGHWLPGRFGEDRKNVASLIRTFLETFEGPGKKKPALILKTNQVNYSLSDREQILNNINRIKDKFSGNLPNIYLLHGELTDEEMNQLNNDSKVKSFVSFTKGEGFGRPLLEAAITGKPVLTTNWSGHTDFIQPDYNILIGGELKNVHPTAANQFLLKESQWFNIDTNIASRAMKDVFKNYKRYWEKSRKQTQYIKNNWTFSEMTKKLNSLLPKVEPSPQTQQLNLPKLKKVNSKKELPKLNLPKLKKVNSKKELPKLNLPKLKKVEA
jgi:glycosyltransferase involved in cell wall biosynthesis